jgi:hypothetical protein
MRSLNFLKSKAVANGMGGVARNKTSCRESAGSRMASRLQFLAKTGVVVILCFGLQSVEQNCPWVPIFKVDVQYAPPLRLTGVRKRIFRSNSFHRKVNNKFAQQFLSTQTSVNASTPYKLASPCPLPFGLDRNLYLHTKTNSHTIFGVTLPHAMYRWPA